MKKIRGKWDRMGALALAVILAWTTVDMPVVATGNQDVSDTVSANKVSDDTLNVWCDVCDVQGVNACQGKDTVAAYEILASGNCGAEGNESSVTWSLDNEGTLTISGTGAMADYELVVDDYPYRYTTPWHNTDNDG